MMVEQSRAVDQVSSLLNNLDCAATKMKEISGKSDISPSEMKDLMKTLNTVNTQLQPTSWGEKKLAPGEETKTNASIEKALAALALFPKTPPRNMEQAVISLFDSLKNTLNTLNKNLRNLKKDHRLGQRVQKTSESKKSD